MVTENKKIGRCARMFGSAIITELSFGQKFEMNYEIIMICYFAPCNCMIGVVKNLIDIQDLVLDTITLSAVIT